MDHEGAGVRVGKSDEGSSDGAAIDLHVTAAADLVAAGVDGAAVLRRAGVAGGLPFLLGADGSYDLQLNRFFRELDGWGVRAANSIVAYARDIMVFCRFLAQSRGGKSIWECDTADLRAYKRVRLHTPGPTQVSVSTWRRSIAALDKWAAWALYEGLISRLPFRYVDRSVFTPQGMRQVRINAESEPDPGRPPVRFVSFEDYLLWRDVGLRGRLPGGRVDRSWRGRHDERNALFADLLIYTGMRLCEASCLLAPEVPGERAAASGLGAIHLGPAVTKRSRARTVFAPSRLVRALDRYVRIERGELVARISADGGYALGEQTVVVRHAGRTGVSLADGGAVPYGRLDPDARRRLLLVTPEGEVAGPLALWLSADGLPVASATWQSVFARANARCERFGIGVSVTPHTLRHSFAVHMLGLLLRQTVAALGEDPARTHTSAQVKRLLVGNPLRRLQLLLGHAQEATVYTYLDVLDEAQEIVASALARWDAQAGALAAAFTGDESPAAEPQA
jgi:site-specific recombinase XerD